MVRFSFLLFLLLALPLRANLGETIQQCVARYGTPVGYSEASPKNPFGTVDFSAGAYTLVIFVLQGKEVGARVSKTDKLAFSSDEIQTILNADSVVGPWVSAPSNDPNITRWTRSDKAEALYDKDKKMIIFTSLEMAQAIKGQ